MKKIQELLRKIEEKNQTASGGLRVEIYGTGLIIYDMDTCDEDSFNTEEEVIKHLENLL